jgi:hypothetical protein
LAGYALIEPTARGEGDAADYPVNAWAAANVPLIAAMGALLRNREPPQAFD